MASQIIKNLRGQGQKEPRHLKVSSALSSKSTLLAHPHEPTPAPTEAIVSPAEARAATRAHIREVGVAVRRKPGRIGKTDWTLAVGLGVGGFEALPPLTLRNLSVVACKLLPHLVEVATVAHAHEFESAGLLSSDPRPVELPPLGVVALASHHRVNRVVFRRVAVECELEDFAFGGVVGDGGLEEWRVKWLV